MFGMVCIIVLYSLGIRVVLLVLECVVVCYFGIMLDVCLFDCISNMVDEGIDVGIRVGFMCDSCFVVCKVVDMRFFIVVVLCLIKKVGVFVNIDVLSSLLVIVVLDINIGCFWFWYFKVGC